MPTEVSEQPQPDTSDALSEVPPASAGTGTREPRRTRANWFLVSGLGVVVMATVVRFAWVSDDALITARSVLNVLHGYGPNFNIDERVQSFTHPLWFAVWTGLSAITGEVVLMPIAMGIAFTAIAVGIVAFVATNNARATLALVGLAISPVFVVWATSGLENPLAMALVGALWLMSSRRSAWWMAAFGAGLAAIVLTRLDLVVLVMPIAIVMLWRADGWKARSALIVTASIPVVAWLGYAQGYYGYAMPATFYAKTNVEIPRLTLLEQGFKYFWATIRTEPQAVLFSMAGLASLIVARTRTALAWAAGIVLYLLYVVWVGGDFMEGRFFAVPFYVATLGIATTFPVANVSPRVRWGITGGFLAILVLLALPSNPVYWMGVKGARWDERKMYGIADERGFYVGADGYSLATWLMHQRGQEEAGGLEVLRLQAQQWSDSNLGRPDDVYIVCGGLGGVGLAKGPRTHIIDPCGLADMYIAQTPYRVRTDLRWRPGHYDRVLPDGYERSVRAGRNEVVDQAAAERLNEVWPRIRHRREPIKPGPS